MAFPTDLEDILPLKNNTEKRKPFTFDKFAVNVIVSRDGFGRYTLWVCDKDEKGKDRKRFGQDNLADEKATESLWKMFLEERPSIFK